MKIRLKLSLLIIGIMTVIISGISFLLLQKASSISESLSMRGMDYLAGQRAEYWNGWEGTRVQALHSLANIMEDYENVPPESRRDRFDAMINSTIISEPDYFALYTVWKPNAVDGMDSQYIGRTGSGSTGQYAVFFSRETGEVTSRTTTDIDGAMSYLTSSGSRAVRVENPTPRKISGRDTYVVRFMVPIINPRTDEVVGGIGCLMDIAPMQSAVADTLKTHKEIFLMAIYSGNGFVMASHTPDRIGSLLSDVGAPVYGDYLEEANQAVLSGERKALKTYSPEMDKNVLIVLEPIQIDNSDMKWTVMIGTEEDYVLAEVMEITFFTIILAGAVILGMVVIVFITLSNVTKPIVKVALTLKDISEGEGDLTRTIPEKGKDEITDLSRYFNLTLEKIRNLVKTIKQQSVVLYGIGSELSSNMNETASAINEITANIQNIKNRTINQSASVSETNATMEQITINIGKLDHHIESQSGSVSQSSSAIEEMLANIQSVAQTLNRNAKNVKELTESSEVGRMGLQDVATDIQEIARESEGLLEINQVMENIASQTNLLSMNAAIEAAHAGESGKGFAVVADEIRKLAESSSEQSKIISSVLKKIKGSIDKISGATDNVINRFEAIDSGIKTVAEQEESIRNAMEEQGEGSKQILGAIGQLNDITHQVKNKSSEMLESSKEIIEEGKNMENVTHEITEGMNEMAAGSDQINIAVHQVNDITIKNRDNISLLVEEVARFKVE